MPGLKVVIDKAFVVWQGVRDEEQRQHPAHLCAVLPRRVVRTRMLRERPSRGWFSIVLRID